MITSAEVREAFIQFFSSRGHEIVPSSPLIPANDPTLLFTNAGMVQFKELFLGKETRSYTRAVSSQRCVRAGGKHNDLENVGYTARHHTFFEMLGNFSFGDYFKREAIQYAWEFLTQELKIPAEKLWVTVYQDDDEAADIWLKEMKIDPSRFSRCGDEDNFWQMGDTGPCGPCSEIFYDHGADVPGGPPGSEDADGDRYIEIWNLVFTQYNRSADGTLTAIPKPSVDTGMGLERVTAVVQNVHNNYDIDLFQHLIHRIAEIAKLNEYSATSLKVIADHIRSTSFLIVDGIVPSNEGRGYVLRRIIRRAIRHGHKIGLTEPFFYKIVATLVNVMGEAYPELVKQQSHIERLLKLEEQQFAKTLAQGLKILEQAIAQLPDNTLPGKVIFQLYDTYGFPADLTGDIARERGLEMDYAGFEQEMEKQRHLSQSASKFAVDYYADDKFEGETEFVGYHTLATVAKVTSIFHDGNSAESLQAGEHGQIILDHTPFYAESGGQVGDTGVFLFDGGEVIITDTIKRGAVHIHHAEVKKGNVKLGMDVSVKVDDARRASVVLNHSATHLLHAALRKVLGEHVTQKGSLVDADRLRFDFSHFEAVTAEQIQELENLVNYEIRANYAADIQVMSPEQAKQSGAMALFGEKYGDEVRVLSFGDFSKELCGGTHVRATGDIGLFKITQEGGIAAGIRRIEAVTGHVAMGLISQQQSQLQSMAELLKTSRDDVASKVTGLVQRNRELEKTLQQLQAKLASEQGSDLAKQAIQVNNVAVLVQQLENVDVKALRDTLDQLKNKLGTAVILLAAVNKGNVSLIAGVTKDSVDKIKASDVVKFAAALVGGKGGGRADMAQAGGSEPDKLPQALQQTEAWISEQLG